MDNNTSFEETVRKLADSIIAVRQGEQKFSEERKHLTELYGADKPVDIIIKVAESSLARRAALVELLSELKNIYPTNPLELE